MIILTIRTDKPEAEIGLYDDQEKLAYETWQAHRELSISLHQKISELLAANGQSLQTLDGIVGFAGPGSFTGLRIGLTVANALAYGLQKPVVAMQSETWIADGIARLLRGEGDNLALPEYGAPVHITTQKK
jgi:tRNA threonylcarbamoyladenosine biosynthesis protein TsaB